MFQLFFRDCRCKSKQFEKLTTSMSKKIVLITNLANTTHFTLSNVLENNQHCFRKDRGNHYLKLLLILAPPLFQKKIQKILLIQNVTMLNIYKYNDSYKCYKYYISIIQAKSYFYKNSAKTFSGIS